MDASFASMQGLSSVSPVSPAYPTAVPTAQSTFVKPANLYKSVKPTLTIHQADGRSLVLHTSGWAGVGLVFDRKGDDGYPLVREVLPSGSAERDGTINVGDAIAAVDGKTTEGMNMQGLRDTIIGPVGSAVLLTVKRQDGNSSRDVLLTRASVEFWALSDANKNMKEQLEAMMKKLRTSESLLNKHQAEIENLIAQRAQVDNTNQQLRAELAEEKSARKQFQTSAAALSQEKRDLEENVESLLKKLSDTTLNFKTAERLARDMTEKARDSDQRRTNEEKLRRLAEEREAATQAEVMQQSAKRREMEKLLDAERDRIRDYDQQKQNAAALNASYKELQQKMLAERASAKTHLALTTHTEQKLELAEKANKKLTAELDALKKELDELEKAAASHQKELSRLGKEKDHMERDVDAASRGKFSAQSSIESANERANILEKRMRDKDALISGLNASLAALKEEVNMARNDSEAAKKEVAARLKQATVYQHEIESLKRQLESDKLVHRGSMEELTKEVQALNEQLAAATHELKRTVETTAKEVAYERQQSHALRTSEGRALQRAAEAEGRMNVSHTEHQKLKTEMAKVEDKLKDALTALAKAKEALRQAEEEGETVKSDRDSLLAELATVKKEMQKAMAKAKEATAALDARKTEQERAETENEELKKRNANLQTSLDGKTREANGHKKTIQGMQAQVAGAAKAKEEGSRLHPRLSSLESQLASLQPDVDRLRAAETKLSTDLQDTASKYTALQEEFSRSSLSLQNQTAEELRELRDMLFALLSERDALQLEVDRFAALPNPVGVGLQIDEFSTNSSAGETVHGFVISKIKQGLSADLSGVLNVGDELLAVNSNKAGDLSLQEVQQLVAGDRGSQVSFDVRRRDQDGAATGFRVVLKRGAWGPEHAVVSPEDMDMLDQKRWPTPGSVTAKHPNMDHILRDTAVKIARVQTVSSSFLARAKKATQFKPDPASRPNSTSTTQAQATAAGTGTGE